VGDGGGAEMIWHGGGRVEMEEGEPALRSCWECNTGHEHLKKVNFLHVCFGCGRYWVFDRFLDTLETDEQFASFMESWGVKAGSSTQDVDAGYRIIKIRIGPRDEDGVFLYREK
jgi:hypothetical protein